MFSPSILATSIVVSMCLLFAFYSIEQNGQLLHNSVFRRSSRHVASHPTCKLPTIDPWHSSLISLFDPLYEYNRKCNRMKLRTRLVNGRLVANSLRDFCWGRCLQRSSDWMYLRGEWFDWRSNVTFECDVVEAKCATGGSVENQDYEWVHTQIYEKMTKVNTTLSAEKKNYDVLFIVLDSTSHTQSERNLPKTINFLTKSMGAVQFPYLNRVAANSKPNAAAMFLGKVAERCNRDVFGAPTIDISMPIHSLCSSPLDNYTTIQDEYERMGYVTSFFDDWFTGLYNYYRCTGFLRDQATHTNVPFRFLWTHPSKLMRQLFQKNSCYTKHHALFEHVSQFLDSYPGIPKFTTIWDTDLGHDSLSSSILADTILYNFFIKNREELKKSFIFLVGDHGLRFGKVLHTKLGSLEQNNPMLLVVPPEELLENAQLMDNLKENSGKLQSHHDTYATLVDILKHQPQSDFTDLSPLKENGGLLGSSFLRQQLGERSCRTLPIPLQYCICEYPSTQIDVSSELATTLGQFVIHSIQRQLVQHNITRLCSEWSYMETLSMEQLQISEEVDVYKIRVKAQPSAVFTTVVRDSRNGTISMGAIDRADVYGTRGDCIDRANLRIICDCGKT